MNKRIPKGVVVDTSGSSHARLYPVPVSDVVLRDGFWSPRLQINREVTLPSQYQQCEETGRIDNFRRAAGLKDVPFQGMYFNDSDVYKWLEAVAWAMASGEDADLSQMMDTVIDAIAAAQQENGYLNTYFMFEREDERWGDLKDQHELYCAGHLMQVAVAHYRVTGNERLLAVACRFADYIGSVFRYGKLEMTEGHPEIEMALVELGRATGEAKYLQQAQFFLDLRGHGLLSGSPQYQDHAPFREIEEITGHAVRAVYLNAGATDILSETGESALRTGLERQWNNMTQRRMYISGGLGARYAGEAFGKDYELPNARAYAETCAAIGSVMWNWRLLQLGGDARFADVMELALYNGALAGLSLDGQQYFYQNPLADDGTHRRQPWFGCACCPPNIARLLASLPGYFYSVAENSIWVHLYAEGSARLTLPDGRQIGLTQHTQYPWEGDVAFEINGEGDWELCLRVPGWCEAGATLHVNGEPLAESFEPGSYARLRRTWHTGDQVRLHLPIPPLTVKSHPHLVENHGRVALMRGPLLYCVEAVDHPGVDLRDIALPAAPEYATEWQPDLLGGVTVLRTQATSVTPDEQWTDRLYRTARTASCEAQRRLVELTAIPYYAWANRDAGAMQVWLRSL